MNRAIITLLVNTAVVSANAADAELLDALADCRAIASASTRLDCYDALAAPTSKEIRAEAQTATVGETLSAQADPGERTPAPDFGLATVQDRQPLRLTAEVVGVQRNRARRQIIELDNGQTWRQADSARLRLRPGDSVEIQAGALGSFLLRKTSGGGSMRIQRLN